MSETLRTLPKNSPERIYAARQIRYSRYLDKTPNCVASRSLNLYIDYFAGLDSYFDYVKGITDSNTLLDIGAGQALAIAQLQKHRYGEGLNCIGTVLTRPTEADSSVGSSVISTSVEMLRGIPDESVAGILAFYSIAYSAVPEYVIQRINQVLVKGGILKAVFDRNMAIRDTLAVYNGLQISERFICELQKLGYDIPNESHMMGEVVVAIKPGGNKQISAQELFEKDKKLYWENLK